MTKFDKAMQKALKEDGKKLRQLTGQDHGPYFDWPPFEDQKEIQMEWPHGIYEK